MSREPHLMSKKDLYLALRHLPQAMLSRMDKAINEALDADDDDELPNSLSPSERRTLACLMFAVADARKDADAAKPAKA